MFSTRAWQILEARNLTSNADSIDHVLSCDYLLALCTSPLSALFRAVHVCLILSHTLGFNWLHLACLRCAWLASFLLCFTSFPPAFLPSTFFPSAWLWLGTASLGSAWLHSAQLGSASLGFMRIGFTLLSLARLGMASSFWKAFFTP